MNSFLSALQSLTTAPDELAIRVYPDRTNQIPPHFPEWHANFSNTGLYVYLGYGSVIFHNWNDEQQEFLTLSANSGRRNGQIENGTISYRITHYRSQVQSLFSRYRERPEAFVPIHDPLGLDATIAEVSRIQIPLLLTDHNVLNNLSIVGDLLPGQDHTMLYANGVQRDGQTCLLISDVLSFLQNQIPTAPVPRSVPDVELTNESSPPVAPPTDAVIVGIDSVVDVDTFFIAEPQQTTTYEDVHYTNTPDYIFELGLSCTLQDIPQLLAPFTVTSFSVYGQVVGARVVCGTEQVLVDDSAQIIQNPAAWDHWVFQQKLIDLSTQQPVQDLFGPQSFLVDLPEVLLTWVSEKVQACIQGIGVLKSPQEDILQSDLSFVDAFKWISLREFQSDQPQWQQYITQTLLPQFGKYKHRLQIQAPVLGTEAVRHAAWHLWAKSLEWVVHAPAKPPAHIHILNQAELRYTSMPVRKNILLRLV